MHKLGGYENALHRRAFSVSSWLSGKEDMPPNVLKLCPASWKLLAGNS
ncbi:hypothetical protein [Persicirhabdus sediminis]|uniref:Uncharacterized protein n=1 Tax=Persicirhabdus sediminis TaxID=454144 RepID=A0A8J7MC61_9BACT|nr:hypothetical protein [Persicirhabdus sediminis]MBK1789898.1 hypothetical protein [Persicirhabdus sediminis]